MLFFVSPAPWVFQSTLPLRGVTPQQQTITRHCSISIHTPLAGSDEVRQLAFGDVAISIHAPLAGSDYKQTQV